MRKKARFTSSQSHEYIGGLNLVIRGLGGSVLFSYVVLVVDEGHGEVVGRWGCDPHLNSQVELFWRLEVV